MDTWEQVLTMTLSSHYHKFDILTSVSYMGDVSHTIGTNTDSPTLFQTKNTDTNVDSTSYKDIIMSLWHVYNHVILTTSQSGSIARPPHGPHVVPSSQNHTVPMTSQCHSPRRYNHTVLTIS